MYEATIILFPSITEILNVAGDARSMRRSECKFDSKNQKRKILGKHDTPPPWLSALAKPVCILLSVFE